MAINGAKVPMKKEFEENLSWLKRELGIGESFDVISREFVFAGKRAAIVFIDGFAKDDIMLLIMRTLAGIDRHNLAGDDPEVIKRLFAKDIPYIEVDILSDLHQVVDAVLAGPLALMVEDEAMAIIIDAREYPARNPEEPDLERVVRGSRDGFVETIVFNTALIRRRVRDPKLRMEMLQAGQRSKTDICISYINDIANPEMVKMVKERIKAITMDGLPMAEKSVEELIQPGSIWNPFPRVRYTERPDVAAVHLFEGHILLLVDTSPSVMILPATFFHHVQHAEEFRQNPAVGAFLRMVRFAGILVSVLILPLWFLFSIEPALLPSQLKYIGPERIGNVPLLWQFLIAEGGITLMRMAAIHTPSALTTALGLIAAVLIGDMAVNIGLFAPEVVLYVAIATVGTFATPSYELGMANNMVRIFLLLSVAAAQLPGFLIGIFLLMVYLGKTKSFGVPYLWPLIPLNLPALITIIVRPPVPIQKTRPSILKPLDPDRQPLEAE
ncbi:MAG: spore germination protein [Syntrophomonadaceae bacterium]|nr:spore germination protein [Syntrophomonadaceae bacterium]